MKQLQRLDSLQAARAIAALSVVLVHSVAMASRYGTAGVGAKEDFFAGLLHAGVDLFFVVSGFVMTYITHGLESSFFNSSVFFVKRIARIVPIYWAVTLFKALLLFQVPSVFNNQRFDAVGTIKSLLFIPYFNADGLMFPVMGVGWTLNYEMFFYGYFALVLMLSRKHLLQISLMVFPLLVAIGKLYEFESPFMLMATDPIVLNFLYGIVVAHIFLNGKSLTNKGAVFSIVLGVSLLLLCGFVSFINFHRVVKWGIPVAMTICGFISLEHNRSLSVGSWLVTIGDSSYSIYLTHTLVLPLFGKILYVAVPSGVPSVALVSGGMAIATVFGHFFYCAFERRLNNKSAQLIKMRCCAGN